MSESAPPSWQVQTIKKNPVDRQTDAIVSVLRGHHWTPDVEPGGGCTCGYAWNRLHRPQSHHEHVASLVLAALGALDDLRERDRATHDFGPRDSACRRCGAVDTLEGEGPCTELATAGNAPSRQSESPS